MHTVRLGTRGSKLALWQADFVARQLQRALPDIDIQIKTIKTSGDKILDTSLSQTGGKGLFTSEIERELLQGSIDIAVHSLKDLPARLEQGLHIGAVLKRENPLDVMLSTKGYTITTLPAGATVGTSSLRRTAQLNHKRSDITVIPLRGNVETRIKKMQQQALDAIVLAHAGVKRLGFENLITQTIEPDVMLPAAGQGAIAVEMRQSDSATGKLLEHIHHTASSYETLAERAFLEALQGGCQVPAGCLGTAQQETMVLQGLVASLDGSKVVAAQLEGNTSDAAQLGHMLADQLLRQGADKILETIRAGC